MNYGEGQDLLNEALMRRMAEATPARVLRKGTVDLGGRMRVASILRSAGITNAETPERIAGSTNEVWRAGNYVIRVGFLPGANRLRREAKLATVLPPETHYPKVIASGQEAFGEWIVVRHRTGRVLSREWSQLNVETRRSATHDVALALKAIHNVSLDENQATELAFVEGEGGLSLPHQINADKLFEQLEHIKSFDYMDYGLIEAAEQRTREVADAFWDHERNGLVHGDLHFENVLSANGVLVAVLDFEWARVGPPEIDIDVLARFCAEPELHVGGDYAPHAADYADVLRWFNEAYPELFGHEFLHDRLMMAALSFEIPSLFYTPPDAPAAMLSEHHPVNRLRRLLDVGTHAESLGWT